MNDPFYVIQPTAPIVPIILSVPHCGTEFPEELREHFIPEKAAQPDDTDWYVHELYKFALEMGITIIHAKYSRWVIDLNRDPYSRPLYNDGRIITALTPTTDFFGEAIYCNDSFHPNEEEVDRRLQEYYWPYYKKIEELIDDRVTTFGKVLFWDAHSIRTYVPTIRQEAFPDLILGNNDEKTAHKNLIEAALRNLENSDRLVTHNTPFKGGHLTRYFGNPENNIHALQLEMTKKMYMEDNELDYSHLRAKEIQDLLKNTFSSLLNTLETI